MSNLGQANDIMYWPEDGLLDQKHVDNYVLMTIYVLCLTDFTILYENNGITPIKTKYIVQIQVLPIMAT